MQSTTFQTSIAIQLQDQTKKDFTDFVEKGIMVPSNALPQQLVEISKKAAPILARDTFLAEAMKALAAGDLEYIIVNNMPIDRHMCKPPLNGQRPANKYSWTSELGLLALLDIGGISPLSYKEEKGEELVHQVAPSPSQENTRSNSGRIKLGMHSDNSILNAEHRPDFLALLALINEPETPTEIASVQKASALLSSKHQRLLQQPLYRLKTPDSFDKAFGNRKIVSEYRPIVGRDAKGSLYAAGNLYAVESKDASAELALAAFGEALEDVSESIVLQTGMAIVFNNGKVFHSRGTIKPGDRYLQRVFGKTNLHDIRVATDTTANDYIFSIKPLLLF